VATTRPHGGGYTSSAYNSATPRILSDHREYSGPEVVDNRKAHKGNLDLFNPENLQSLCNHRYDSSKQIIDKGKKVAVDGVDGYPIELG